MDRVSAEQWDSALQTLGIAEAEILPATWNDPGRRVYLAQGRVYKIVFAAESSTSLLRRQTLSGERDVLTALNGVRGVPSVYSFRSLGAFEALEMQAVEGETWNLLPRRTWVDFLVAVKIIRILISCSFRGIVHNDLHTENVIVSADGECFLIDFDQAMKCGRVSALLANCIGISAAKGAQKVSILKTLGLRLLPERVTQSVRKVNSRLERRRMRKLPRLTSAATTRARKLLHSWKLAQKSYPISPDL